MSVQTFSASELGMVLACARDAGRAVLPHEGLSQQQIESIDRGVGEWLAKYALHNAKAYAERYREPVDLFVIPRLTDIRNAARGARSSGDCAKSIKELAALLPYNTNGKASKDAEERMGAIQGLVDRWRQQAEEDRASSEYPTGHTHVGRKEAVKQIRECLKKRTGRSWSVKGGSGTAWSWIDVDAPPARKKCDFKGEPSENGTYSCAADRAVLSKAMGLHVHPQGVSIPPGRGCYEEHVARACGRTPTMTCDRNWD